MAKQVILTQNNFGIPIELQFVSNTNSPIDLTDKTIEVAISYDGTVIDVLQATISSYTNGTAYIITTTKHTSNVGLYTTFWSVRDKYGYITAQSDLYYYVKEEYNGASSTGQGKGTIEEKFDKVNSSIETLVEENSGISTRVSDIETINTKLTNNIKTINTKLTNNIKTINSQLDNKVNKSDIETINSQLDNNIKTINTQLTNNIKTINSQLDNKANKNEVRKNTELLNMSDLSQEIKTAMTGGSVAIVGDEMVLPNNVTRFAITQTHLSDDLRKELTTIDILNYDLNEIKGYFDVNLKYVSNSNYTTTLPIPCKLGDEIIVNQCVSGTSAYYCCLLDINQSPISVLNNGDGSSLPTEHLYKINNSNAKYVTFTTSTGRVSSLYIKKLSVKNISETINDINKKIIETKDALSDYKETIYEENNQHGYFNSDGTLTTSTQTSYRNTLLLKTNYGDNWKFKSYGIGASAYQVVEYDINKIPLGAYIPGEGSSSVYTTKQHSIKNNNAKYIAFCYYNADLILYKNEIVNIDSKINNNNILYGKTIVGLGDSLMYGMGLDRDKPWLALCGIKNNMKYYNCGINGKKIAGTDGIANEFETLLQNNNVPDEIDYIVIDGGANDNANGISIGESTDTTVTTFKGAMNVLIQKILDKYPTAKILFLTNYSRYPGDINFVDAMIERCEYYSIPCFDNFRKSGINFLNPDNFHTKRNLIFENQQYKKHFSETGYEYLLPIYENLLKGI